MFLTPSFKLTTHKNKKITHINSPMTASQVLQKPITLLHMIHPVTSMDGGYSLEFPMIRILFHESGFRE
jgi:hypothetical protein